VKGTDVDVTVAYNGGTGEATAPAPGAYDFYCRLHPEMTGTIIVT
jgi:plastocyanin